LYERSWEPKPDVRASDLLAARALAWTGEGYSCAADSAIPTPRWLPSEPASAAHTQHSRLGLLRPDSRLGALLLAGAVAIVAGALSLRWSSKLVARIGVVGALAVPVPIA
jgi:hypothetical protein